jgi:hypothetical protein
VKGTKLNSEKGIGSLVKASMKSLKPTEKLALTISNEKTTDSKNVLDFWSGQKLFSLAYITCFYQLWGSHI